jgi:cyclase
MLKKRLIPKLQIKTLMIGGNETMALVNTTSFDQYSKIGDPISQAKIYQAQAADELIFLDLDSHLHSKNIFINIIRSVSEEIFMPITVGGGVDSLDYIRELLQNGADKISINTAAVEDDDLVINAARFFGNQCVVVSIDFARSSVDGKYRVFTHGGSNETKLDPVVWAKRAEGLGAGEILLTSIEMDGSHKGLDIDIIRRISESVSIPVIASGGCGKASHFIDGFLKGKVDAIAAGTFFSYKDQNPMQTRAQILNAGIPMRVHT